MQVGCNTSEVMPRVTVDELLHLKGFVNVHCKKSRIVSVVSSDNTGVTRVSAAQVEVDPWFFRMLMISHFLGKRCFGLYVESPEWNWTVLGESCSGS